MPGWCGLRRPGRIGAVVAQAGFAAMAISSVGSIADGVAVVLGPLFAVGLLIVLVGLLVLGDHGGSLVSGVARLVIAGRVGPQRPAAAVA